ncbi:MAG: zinc ribbon domain-containing protein [Thermoguttaceae bacterium]
MGKLTELMQTLDRLQRQIGDLKGRLRRGPALIRSQEANVAQLSAKLQQHKDKQTQLKLDAKEKEKLSNDSEQAIARRKVQMSEAKNNKDYQALKSQIELDEAAGLQLAEEAINAIELFERFASTIQDVERELQKGEEILKQTQQRFAEEEKVIRVELEKYSAELVLVEQGLPYDFREVYDRLVRTHGGEEVLCHIAVKFCSGCQQTVPINSIALVIQGKPICCSTCGCLLYVQEGYQFERG